jgi:hypothetical protein
MWLLDVAVAAVLCRVLLPLFFFFGLFAFLLARFHPCNPLRDAVCVRAWCATLLARVVARGDEEGHEEKRGQPQNRTQQTGGADGTPSAPALTLFFLRGKDIYVQHSALSEIYIFFSLFFVFVCVRVYVCVCVCARVVGEEQIGFKVDCEFSL